MSAADSTRFDELMSRHLDEALTEAETAELAALLAEPLLAERFLGITRLNSEIAGLLAAPVPNAAMVDLVRSDIQHLRVGEQPAPALRLSTVDLERVDVRSDATISSGDSSPRKRHSALRPLAWAAVLIAFACLAAAFLMNRSRHEPTAIVASVQGDVRCSGPHGGRKLTEGQTWRPGETMRTVGARSALTMAFPDGTQLDFGGNVIVINQSTRRGLRFELKHGEVRGLVRRQKAGRPFSFVTSEAEVLGLGAKLRLGSGAHHTRLEVREGEVRIRRRHDGVELTVKAGQFAVVSPNVPFVVNPLPANTFLPSTSSSNQHGNQSLP